ncbi:MAG: hypothetical protein Q8K94_02420 [Moraxellaceae bacterium]|nr:hypothetical protein [Moraxellaceae bacterium]MDP1775451.1 hypothetical protein [Moraxellaceae bacterium]
MSALHDRSQKGRHTILLLILMTWLHGGNVFANTEVPTDAFIQGFSVEVSNRTFALQAMKNLSKRSEGSKQHTFWQAYLRLEQFNVPHYQAAALSWGLDSRPERLAKAKAFATNLVPMAFMSLALRPLYASTVKYAKKLRKLRLIGPTNAQAFLNYMVEQEELQVEMMRLALRKDYAAAARLVDEFIAKHTGTSFTSEQ